MSRAAATGPACTVKWCDYSDSRVHPHCHIHHLGDVVTSTYPKHRVIALTAECGLAETVPLPVLSIGYDGNGAAVTVRLTWTEAEHVAGLLLDAKKRHGG